MRTILAVSSILGLALAGFAPRHAGIAASNGGVAAASQHDVAVKMRVQSQTGSTVKTQIVVQNRGRKVETQVTVSVFADAPIGTPLWTGTVTQLKAHRKRTTHAEFDVPSGTTSLVAVAHGEQSDDNPGSNLDSAPVGGDGGGTTGGTAGGGSGGVVVTVPPAGGTPGGTTGGTAGGTTGGTTTVPMPSAAVLAGAATYSSYCASCHGADAKGTTSGPRLIGRSSSDVYEAMRQGPSGMPKFLTLTSTDAKNIAAFLKDPAAATIPTPVITPPASGQAPTYTNQIKAIMDSNCATCHTGTFAPMGVVLDSYAGVSASASVALTAMQGGTMPPSGPLSSTLINTFQDWINGGKQQ